MKKIVFVFLMSLLFFQVGFPMDDQSDKGKEKEHAPVEMVFPPKMYPSEISEFLAESEKHICHQKKHIFFKELIKIVRSGDLDGVKKLMEEGLNSRIIEANDFNTFKFDVKENTFVFYLFSVLVKQDNGYCFKHLPLDQDKLEQVKACVKYLMTEYKLDLSKKNKDSWNAMHAAASCGATDFMQILLALDPELLEIKHERGKTPLLIAANVGNFDSIDFLLENEANVKATDSRGWNIFHVFAMADQLDCCKQVINGAAGDKNNLNIIIKLLKQKDNEQKTPAQVAFTFRHGDFGNYLLNLDGVN